MRSAYESGDFAAFDREKLIGFRNARETFSGKDFEALFKLWKSGGDAAVNCALSPKQALPRKIQGSFSSHLLPHDYDLFATVSAA